MLGFPVIIPPPSGLYAGGLVSGIYVAKAIITGDTLLSSDEYDILLDLGDSDRDIPLFVFPSGLTIHDVGFETFQVFTESVGMQFGDSADSNGWASTVSFVATNTDAAGVISWQTMHEPTVGNMMSSVHLDDTTWVPAYTQFGPRVMYSDSADTGDSTITNLDTDMFELGAHRHHINVYADGAVVATGGVAVYLKYSYENIMKMAPSSDLGIYD